MRRHPVWAQNPDRKLPFLKQTDCCRSISSQHCRCCCFSCPCFCVLKSNAVNYAEAMNGVCFGSGCVSCVSFFLFFLRRDEKSHVARNIVAPYSRMCLLMNYHVHLARWLTGQPHLLCWCNFPAPTTTSTAAAAHSPTLYPRQLLCTSDDSPDEI